MVCGWDIFGLFHVSFLYNIALQVVFGSLYNADIALNPLEIVPILATATMFQLDGLIEQCTEVMMETINPKVCL